MRWFVLTCGVVLVAAGLYLRWQEPTYSPLVLAPDEQTLRNTLTGPVTGGVTSAGSWAWLGIPYAAPPEGALRWREPQPPSPWTIPREATRFGAVCPQFASAFSVSAAKPGTLIGDEDCLSLNVYAPGATQPGAALPVMVFIHGGGNTIGSSIPYDGSAFVQEQGVLMVTINYRLGILGWLSHSALRSSAANPAEASGNFALLDMVAALGWVRDNIESFGGDPARVTLFGESAGGRNVYSLLATPLARGLFQGAIIQSGYPGTFSLQRAEGPADDPQPGHYNSSHELLLRWLQESDAQTRGAAAVTLAGLEGETIPTFIRGLSLEAVLSPVAVSYGMYSAPALFRDGYVLPKEPLPEVFADPLRWNRVPLLVGTNRDEMKLFLALSDTFATKKWGMIPAPADAEQYRRLAAYHSDAWKAAGVDLPLSVINEASPQLPLFAYRFDWDDMRSNWLVDLPELLGAAHALELDFLFRPVFARSAPGVFYPGNRVGRESLGRAMRDYWAGFAYSGRPGGGRSAASPAWPRWTRSDPQVMLLDEASDGGVRPENLFVDVADVKQRLADETYLSERLRCALYVDLYLDNNGLPELFNAREYQLMGCAQFPAWSLARLSR